MPNTRNHEYYMRRAIELGRHNPHYPFGAVIVDGQTGAVMAEGWNRVSENPIWHGEIDAINRCAHDHPGIDWKRLTLYTTGEPCPMCQSAIHWASISVVVFGTSIRTLQRQGWGQIDILSEEVVRRASTCRCTIVGGVLEAECDALFEEALKLQKGVS